MVNGDSKKLQELISIFKSAEERVESVLLETNAESVEDLKIKVDKKLERVNVGLIKDSISWAKTDLPTAYKEGERKIDGSISRRLHIDETAIESSYISLAQNVQHATDHAKNVVNQAIKEAESLHGYGATVGNVKDVIQETLARENGSMIITYNNGAKMPLSAYAQMLARTSRIETANTGSFDRCKELGLDLVRCTKVPGCCPYCFKYEDKVYSISGRDTRFPSLYDTALQNGYNIMHPNCRHEFLPFAAELERPEVIEKLIKESNHFEDHDPNSKLFQLYNRNQALQRQWIKESREFHEMQAYFTSKGENPPYSTIGAFRRSYRAEKDSLAYEKAHFWKRTFEEKQQKSSQEVDISVKWNIINSKEYFDCVEKITNKHVLSVNINNSVQKILKHRDGTSQEDLYLFDARTGKLESSVVDSKLDSAVESSPEMKSKLLDKSKDFVLVHNHPKSSYPSAADLNSLYDNSNVSYGVIACHNGTLIKYTKPNKKIEQKEIYSAILGYVNLGYTNETANKKAFERLSEKYNFTIEVYNERENNN